MIFNQMRTRCFAIFSLFIFSFLSADELTERGFYTLSSLRYSLEEPQGDIFFEEKDIDFLWDKVFEIFSDNEDILTAQSIYYNLVRSNSDQIQGAQALDEVCERLFFLWDCLKKKLSFDVELTQKALISTKDNPDISPIAKKEIAKYLIPSNHPYYSLLEAIFHHSRATSDQVSFLEAGFSIVDAVSTSGITLAKHPGFHGSLFKIYLDGVEHTRGNIPGWKWLVNRCEGAQNIRDLIVRKKLKCFSVPDKFLYAFPREINPVWTTLYSPQPVLLLVTDMEILPSESVNAWKTVITTQHLNELYEILSHGYGTTSLPSNVPYTKSGKFAFIDTEYPKRKLQYSAVKSWLSPEMSKYWDKLVRRGGA